TALLAASSAAAIKITYPTKDEALPIASGIKVKWSTVSTDPASAHLFLVNMAGGHTPYSKDLGEVNLSDGSIVISEKDVPADSTYQFNFQSVDEHNTGILSQSEQFSIINLDSGANDIETTLVVDKTSAKKTATAEGVTAATTVSTVSASVTGTAAQAEATGSASVSGTGSLTGTAAAATSSAVEQSGAEVKKGGSMLALVAAGVVAL
ncbi:hypothetical protein QBC43DRAFT_171468, partial [Cladorrhinum sp. PSN259]